MKLLRNNVNEMNRFEPYKILKEHQLFTFTLVQWHFQSVLKSLSRKVTIRQSFRNPFTIVLSETIYKEVYYQAYRVIRDYPTHFDTETKTIKKSGVVKSYEIKFTAIQSLRFHLKQLSNIDDTDQYLKKSFPHGEKGEVLVSEEQPALFFFKVSTNTLTVTMKFSIKNRHGTVCTI